MIVKATLPAYGGYSIARDEKVMLIRGAIPGEVVDVTVTEKRRDYSVATVSQVLEPSEFRVEPGCPVFGICGGCHLQYMTYEKQVSLKEEVLLDSLSRLGGIDLELSPSFTDSQWHYRHRAQLKISKEGAIGFFRESSRDVVVFESCPLMTENMNRVFREIRDRNLHQSFREILLSSGETVTALLRGDGAAPGNLEQFRDAGITGIAFNETLLEGAGYALFDLNGLKYTVSPWSFFQAHWELNRRVADSVLQRSLPLEGRTVLDLYAGAGNFSLPFASHASEVVLVEENPYAVEDGSRNLKMNNIKNCRFIRSSAEKYRISRKFDLLILDPPRPGMTTEVSKKVLEALPATILYISCNPSTLARDLKKLKDKYEIVSVQMIDFFPNTFHIEALAVLRLK